MSSTYIDAITYSKAATGINNPLGLYGNLGRITQASAGASSLTTVAGLTIALSQYDALYITDGPNSEVVQVGSGGASVNATTIPLQSATQYAHTGGAVYCTDGSIGSLGQALFESSRWLEDICYQSLWQTTYTNEALTMPTPRANIDNQGGLNFRPLHFPVTAVSALSIATSNSSSAISYDITEVQLDGLQRIVTVPILKPLNSQQQNLTSQYAPPFSRSQKATLTTTYTAGFASGAMPWAVTRAATLLTSEMFNQMANPQGADTVMMGKRNVMYTMRGDLTGESLLVKQAKNLLRRYSVEVY